MNEMNIKIKKRRKRKNKQNSFSHIIDTIFFSVQGLFIVVFNFINKHIIPVK